MRRGVTDLQRAIQGTVQRPLTSQELWEAENNLMGLFGVLMAINRRERLVDIPEPAAYADAL